MINEEKTQNQEKTSKRDTSTSTFEVSNDVGNNSSALWSMKCM